MLRNLGTQSALCVCGEQGLRGNLRRLRTSVTQCPFPFAHDRGCNAIPHDIGCATNPANLHVVKVTEADLTYVAIDGQGQPRPVPR